MRSSCSSVAAVAALSQYAGRGHAICAAVAALLQLLQLCRNMRVEDTQYAGTALAYGLRRQAICGCSARILTAAAHAADSAETHRY
jgi:hypothetical protein